MHIRLKSRATNASLVDYLKSFARGNYMPSSPNEMLVVGVSNRDYLPSQKSWHVTNRFDDWIVHVWRDEDNILRTRWCPATLEPGAEAVAAGQTGSYEGKAVNKNGAGCLIYGFHEKIWYPHLHNWKYSALCMKSLTQISRNQNSPSSSMGAVFEPGSVTTNKTYSFNCHRTKASRNRAGLSKDQIVQSIYTRRVGHWSHGCAVHLFNDDLSHLMRLCDSAPKSEFFSPRENKDVIAPEVSYLIISGDMLSTDVNKSKIASLRRVVDSENFVTSAHGIAPKSNYELANMCTPVSGRSFGDIAFYNNDLHPMFVVCFNKVVGYDNGNWLETSINYRDLLTVGRLK
jgi:hypothetical protein